MRTVHNQIMKKLLINILLCAGLAAAVSAKDSSCCSPGYYLQKHSVQPFCKHNEYENTTLALDCPTKPLTITYREDFKFVVNEDGQLVLLFPNRRVVYEAGSFCDSRRVVKRGNTRVHEHSAVVCVPENEKVIDDSIHGYCLLLSVIFLIITATVYIARGQHRDLQGKSIINLCVSLGAGLGLLVIMKMLPYSDMNWCAARGFLAYFFMVASFFWSNAISIQVLWSLRSLPGTKTTFKWREYAYYCIYAWGIPVVLTAGMAVINFMPGDHLKPGIGLNHCWFFDKTQQWYYMYSVVSVLLVVNITLFLSATVFICCYGFPTQHDTLKHKFTTCLQLFFVTGIPWITEMVSSTLPSHVAWEISDLFNALQGVWIFLVLIVLQRKAKQEDKLLYNINISVEQPYDKIGKY